MLDEQKTFEELRGDDVETAVVKLWALGCSGEIQKVRDGDFVTCDFIQSRVRVWYDASTNRVTQVIRG